MFLEVYPQVQSKIPFARFAWTIYQDVKVTPPTEALCQIMVEEQKRVKTTLTLETLYQEAGIIESRRAFKALGLDPARYRPSQEGLLRRILNGKEMYFINSGVDVCNLLSIRYRLPMGLHDWDKISGNLILRVGTAQDVYAALNEREVQCEDKLILCDGEGPVGSPYVDSKRTAITVATKNFLHIVYFCYDGLSGKAFEDMGKTFNKFCGGKNNNYKFIKAG